LVAVVSLKMAARYTTVIDNAVEEAALIGPASETGIIARQRAVVQRAAAAGPSVVLGF